MQNIRQERLSLNTCIKTLIISILLYLRMSAYAYALVKTSLRNECSENKSEKGIC